MPSNSRGLPSRPDADPSEQSPCFPAHQHRASRCSRRRTAGGRRQARARQESGRLPGIAHKPALVAARAATIGVPQRGREKCAHVRHCGDKAEASDSHQSLLLNRCLNPGDMSTIHFRLKHCCCGLQKLCAETPRVECGSTERSSLHPKDRTFMTKNSSCRDECSRSNSPPLLRVPLDVARAAMRDTRI